MRRVFNALTGEEVKHIIMREVAASFAQHSVFKPHITCPEVKWSWNLTVDIYPREPGRITMQGGAEYVEASAVRSDGTVDHGGAELEKVVLEGAEDVTREGKAPDEVRMQEGLTVTSPGPSDFGIVDKPLDVYGNNSAVIDNGPRGLTKPEVQAQVEMAHTANQARVAARGPLEGQANFGVRRRG